MTRGFTLIEMLVVITIIMLMMGGGIAAFITFNDKQILRGAGQELQSYLRSAQQKAQYGDKPEACDKLLAYAVTANQTAPITANVVARCANGNFTRTSYEFPSQVELSAPLNINFKVLHGGSDTPGPVQLNSRTTDRNYTFAVTAGGEITAGVLNEDN